MGDGQPWFSPGGSSTSCFLMAPWRTTVGKKTAVGSLHRAGEGLRRSRRPCASDKGDHSAENRGSVASALGLPTAKVSDWRGTGMFGKAGARNHAFTALDPRARTSQRKEGSMTAACANGRAIHRDPLGICARTRSWFPGTSTSNCGRIDLDLIAMAANHQVISRHHHRHRERQRPACVAPHLFGRPICSAEFERSQWFHLVLPVATQSQQSLWPTGNG